MSKYSHLTYSDLIKIETLLEENMSIPDIAIRIGKAKTTIYRLLADNSDPEGKFQADAAWEKIRERKSQANIHPRIVANSILDKYIVEKIETRWSPEQIAGRWKTDSGEALSHETIYKFMYAYHPELVKLYFRRKGKKYQHNRKEKYQIKDRRMIDERATVVELRSILGHWEGDTIVGKDHQGAIATNVERLSGLLLASKLDKATAANTADVLIEDFLEIPEVFRLSVTFDNGREFAKHKDLEESANITVYFAHAYSPWERGTNENTNGLLREYIPKGTDLSTVSAEDLAEIVLSINNRPRKRLGYRTPLEVWQSELAKVAVDSGM